MPQTTKIAMFIALLVEFSNLLGLMAVAIFKEKMLQTIIRFQMFTY